MKLRHRRRQNNASDIGSGQHTPRHKASDGNALRAAVLGANDGLISNLSLVMGIAGAATDNRTILITGLAGLIAGACSMALGEWLSVTSSREFYAHQIENERSEFAAYPLEEERDLTQLYESKGLPSAQAERLAQHLMADPEMALDVVSREELGIDPEGLGGSAAVAAATSFLLFSGGAIFPVIPFFFLSDRTAIMVGLALSLVALGIVGAATSMFTGRGILFSAFRQIVIGSAAAAITYGTGKILGATIAA